MALQGTLETFSVPEVLRLLSSTRKTGLMALGGDRGKGKVWLDEGRIVAAESDQDKSGEVNGVLFDLLRFKAGEFVFEPETSPAEADSPTEVDAALERAEGLLAEWHELEAVVPSLDVGVRLRPEIDGPVTVTGDQWSALVAIGSGTSVAGVGTALELGELDTCRRLRDLVEAELVEISDDVPTEPAHGPVPATLEDTLASTSSPNGSLRDAIRETVQGLDDDETPGSGGLVDHDLSSDEVADLGSNLASFVAQPSTPEAPEPDDVETEIILDDVEDTADAAPADEIAAGEVAAEADDPADEDPAGEDPASEDPDGEDPDGEDPDGEDPDGEDPDGEDADAGDFMAQLSNLSPKAAAAIEATSEESGGRPGSDGAADLGEPEADEEINRNALLKFLSSTKN